MSANDYIALCRQKNPRVFKAKTIRITPESLEEQLKLAYEAGQRAGHADLRARSVFETLFGPQIKP